MLEPFGWFAFIGQVVVHRAYTCRRHLNYSPADQTPLFVVTAALHWFPRTLSPSPNFATSSGLLHPYCALQVVRAAKMASKLETPSLGCRTEERLRMMVDSGTSGNVWSRSAPAGKRPPAPRTSWPSSTRLTLTRRRQLPSPARPPPLPPLDIEGRQQARPGGQRSGLSM